MGKKRDMNETTFYAKRAMAQAEINEFQEFMKKENKTYDEYRLGISRFFVDEDWIRAFLELINRSEEKGIDLNENVPFQKAWKEIAYWQHNKAVRQTYDAVTIIASMLGGRYEKRRRKIRSMRFWYDLP